MNGLETRAATVGWLLSQGLNSKEIETITGLDQSGVSRAKSMAMDRLWYREVRSFDWPPEASPGEIEAIQSEAFPQKLKLVSRLRELSHDRNGCSPHSVSVVHVPENHREPYAAFAIGAATFINAFLHKSEICAVAWGRTIWHIVQRLQTMGLNKSEPKTFVPISGEPLNRIDRGHSPSELANRLAEVYGSKQHLSLQGVPARIPKDMAADAETILSYIGHCHDYRAIFGDGDGGGLIDDADMILSGIGNAETGKDDPWYREIEEMESGIDLTAIAQGNICGVWLPKAFGNEQQQNAVEDINTRSTGMHRGHIERCAEKSNKKPKLPGVVVVAREPEKADVLISTVGVVSNYVVSRALADTLLKKL